MPHNIANENRPVEQTTLKKRHCPALVKTTPAKSIEDRLRNRRDVQRHHVTLARNSSRNAASAGLFCPASAKFCHAVLCRKTKEPAKPNSIWLEIIYSIPSATKAVRVGLSLRSIPVIADKLHKCSGKIRPHIGPTSGCWNHAVLNCRES